MKDLTAVYFNNTVGYSGENRGLMNAVFTKIEGGDFSSCLIPELCLDETFKKTRPGFYKY